MIPSRMLSLLVMIGLFAHSCRHEPPATEARMAALPVSQLGTVAFSVSGAPAALAPFEQGLLLLHSFEYEDARTAFREAQAADSSFAMAYWGEAMTYNHPLWARQEREAALEALQRLAPTEEERLALAPTPLEKDFLRAVHVLYGEGTKVERDLAYSEFMADLHRRYPDHHEVAAFYALSLLGSSATGRDAKRYQQSAELVQTVIADNPLHPGALHYLIHSYDDPEHARLARTAADEYAQVAPDATHALHMPSHIYLALGQWDRTIDANIASWNASVRRMQRIDSTKDARSYHAYSWLQYALLQSGQDEQARQLLQRMIRFTEADPQPGTRAYLIAMLGGYLAETGQWEDSLANYRVMATDLNIVRKAGVHFIDGMRAYHRQNASGLEAARQALERDRKLAELQTGREGIPMCNAAGVATKAPSTNDIAMAKIMEAELAAYAAIARGANAEADAWFERGMALEADLPYAYGPPDVFKPVHEAYAEHLLATNRPAAALRRFDECLQRQPRRLRSLRGKLQAARTLQQDELANDVSRELALMLQERKLEKVL